MSKKLTLACMALVAFAAFALPATASASPRLCETIENTCVGHTLATGVKIHAHNVGNTLMTNGGATLVTCTAATMTGTLTRNDATAVEGTIEKATFTGTGAGGKCTSALAGDTTVTTKPSEGEAAWNGLPWCVKASGAADTFTVRGGACSEASRAITFVLHTSNIGTCRYTRSTAVEGTLTTHTSSSEDAVLTVSGTGEEGITKTKFTKEAGSGVLCPETGTLDMSFTMTTDNEPTFTTLYIENV